MLLGTCKSGYSLITEHKSRTIGMWDGKIADKGDYLFEVPEECITSQEPDMSGDEIEYIVDSTLGNVIYIGREE